GDVVADDVIVEHRLDLRVGFFGVLRVVGAAVESDFFGSEGYEDDGLVELVLAHHARQLHHGSGAAGVVGNPGRHGIGFSGGAWGVIVGLVVGGAAGLAAGGDGIVVAADDDVAVFIRRAG